MKVQPFAVALLLTLCAAAVSLFAAPPPLQPELLAAQQEPVEQEPVEQTEQEPVEQTEAEPEPVEEPELIEPVEQEEVVEQDPVEQSGPMTLGDAYAALTAAITAHGANQVTVGAAADGLEAARQALVEAEQAHATAMGDQGDRAAEIRGAARALVDLLTATYLTPALE